jgi:RNA polymerase sigma factor (sigma-70 family)
VLGERVASSLSLSPNQAWRLFEKLFNKDIENLVRKRFPRDGKAEREDIRQNLHLRLIENDYRRVRAYKGKDSFPGFIMVVVNNLLLDMMRQKIGRRRLPAKISRLPEWQQRVFELAAWEGLGMNPDRIAEALEGKIQPLPSPADIGSVLDQLAPDIAEALATDAAGREVSVDTPAGQTVIEDIGSSSNPEDDLIKKEEEEQNKHRDELINRAAEKLPPKERMYRSLTKDSLEPMPPRIIARTMAISVDEANLLKQRMDRWLKKIVQDYANTGTGPSDMGRSAI